jgi:YD repeat-containing protein
MYANLGWKVTRRSSARRNSTGTTRIRGQRQLNVEDAQQVIENLRKTCADQRLALASDWLTQTTSYLYNAIGQPLTMTLPNGVTSSFGYDSAERLSSITHQGITQALGSYAYALDAVGNRVGVTETMVVPGAGISTTAIGYNYDTLYRLKSANYSTGAVFSYTYDAVGNRLTQTTLTNSTNQ